MAEQLATLTLTLNSSFALDDEISFSTTQAGALSISEVCKSVRSGANEFTFDDEDEDIQASFLHDALTADYDDYLDFSYDLNEVVITALTSDISFSDISVPDNVSYSYVENVEPDPVFAITEITAQSTTYDVDRDITARFDVSVENGTAPYVLSALMNDSVFFTKTADTASDLYLEYFRQPSSDITISIEDDNGDVATYDLPSVDTWTLDSVSVNTTTVSATVVANTTTTNGDISTTKQYSLDDESWQDYASFSDITDGDYTMYVMDELGATASLDFSVTIPTEDKPDPVFIIEDANSIKHTKRIDYDSDNVPGLNNTTFTNYQKQVCGDVQEQFYLHPIHTYDTVINQLKTNYDNVTITVKDKDDNEVSTITAVEEVVNLDQTDTRDALLREVSEGDYAGYVFLYFVSGTIYNDDGDDETYTNTSKKVYSFAKNGDTYTISGTDGLDGVYEKIDISFEETDDDGTTYYGVVLDLAFSGDAVQSCVLETNYDVEQYNIWEYSIDGSLFDEGIYNIEVFGSDDSDDYSDVYFDTEYFEIITDREGTVLFEAYHDDNTIGIDFTTGIKLKLRTNGRFAIPEFSEEDDDFTTSDGDKVILKSVVTTSVYFESMLIPWYIALNIAKYSGLDNLEINKVAMVKGSNLEDDSKDSEQNVLRVVKRDYIVSTSTITDETGLTTVSYDTIGDSDTDTIIGDNNN